MATRAWRSRWRRSRAPCKDQLAAPVSSDARQTSAFLRSCTTAAAAGYRVTTTRALEHRALGSDRGLRLTARSRLPTFRTSCCRWRKAWDHLQYIPVLHDLAVFINPKDVEASTGRGL